MRARHYLVLVDGLVVAKHAVGPERQPDGTETYPAVPAGWVPVPFETYRSVLVGFELVGDTYQPPAATRRPERIEERLMRIEAMARAGAKRIVTLETQVAQGATRIQTLTTQLTALTTQLAALTARVTALENV